jgi:hypothetical protein
MLTEHELAILGTLDALRESVDSLYKFLRHRAGSKSADITSVLADTRRVRLLEGNNYRHMATVTNDSTAIMYLSPGPAASLDRWSVKLAAGDYYEIPPGYTGPVTAVWDAVNGQARIAELT